MLLLKKGGQGGDSVAMVWWTMSQEMRRFDGGLRHMAINASGGFWRPCSMAGRTLGIELMAAFCDNNH